MEFEIIVKGDSGNCSINKDEKEFLIGEIAKILQNSSIDDFDIIIN